jgi:hypothetical protein
MLPPIESVIEQVIRDLKTPAGGSDQFSSLENILKNRQLFVERCHETWKRLHHETLQRLFFFEGFLRREKTNPMGSAAKEYAEYHQAVIRRVNDSIIWSVCNAMWSSGFVCTRNVPLYWKVTQTLYTRHFGPSMLIR